MPLLSQLAQDEGNDCAPVGDKNANTVGDSGREGPVAMIPALITGLLL